MPTLTIACTGLSAPRRRAAALGITRWLTRHGVDGSHVVVRFEPVDEERVFVGGWPVAALPPRPEDGVPHHVSVVCHVSPDRDGEFRAGLAAAVAGALGVTDRTAFFYLEFRPASPADVYLAAAGPLHRSDRPAGAPASEGPTP
ncbi:hypothetical protein [Streptomyces sp. DH12]|uniref:hypothetical protein n=1 Tax=Streptomyces sp. DH12 TaxID=2857010 RepID=UPI001E3AF4B8|nr:hypothetical protein [Streptomyces sp. DH12]